MTRGFRSLWLIPLLALLVGAFPLVASAQQQFISFRLDIRGDTDEVIVDGRCRILTAGAQTDATIYTTGTLATAATNPLTIDSSAGTCTWYAPSTTTSFDAIVAVTAGPFKGSVQRVDNVTRAGQKKVVVSRSLGLKAYMVTIPVNATANTISSGITLPAGTMLTHATLETTTAVAASRTLIGFAAGGHGYVGSICDGSAAVVGVIDCELPRALVVVASTIAYSTQGHGSGGYATIYALPSALNEP